MAIHLTGSEEPSGSQYCAVVARLIPIPIRRAAVHQMVEIAAATDHTVIALQ